MPEQANLSPELRARVALEKHRFRKAHSLGQNFLLSGALIDGLLDAARIEPDDNILEIGPGAGVMTLSLARRARRVLAVEVDRDLQPVLTEVLEGQDNARVVFEDAMKADLRALTGEVFDGEPYRVVANLPYYITADVLLKLTGCVCPPDSVCVMVQKEAAERIMSAPGCKQWCALAALLQFYGDARVLADVPPEAFDPPPHVESRFIRIDRWVDPPVKPTDPALYARLIRAAFAMRRKTLANNLKAAFGLDQAAAREALAAAGLDERVRGEALTLEALARLSDALSGLR